MGGGSGSGRHGGQGGQGDRGGDLMTEQMHTLLEMLRAAKADDMMALEVAEARAVQNKEHMRRLEKERERRDSSNHRRGNSGGNGGANSGGGGRPALEASESVEIARAEKEAARRQQRFEARQREYERQQQVQAQPQEEGEGQIYPEEWEEDSRDMTRMGDSTDLTRATYEMARTADLEEAAAMAQAQAQQAQAQDQGDANRSGQSNESDRSGRHRRLAEDMAALQLDGNGGGGYGQDAVEEEVAPLKPPAPSRYSSPDGSGRSRRRSDEGRAEDLERRAQQRQKNRAHNKRRSYHDEPLEPHRPSERVPETSAHGDGDGGGESRTGGSKTTASDDWGERQAEAYTMHHTHGNEDDNVNPDEPMEEEMEEEDGEELSHHTREEMGPPMSLEDEEAYYHRALAKERAAEQHKYDARREERREQSSSNVDADIQSRVLRQLENDEGAGGDYYNDDDGDDNYDEEEDDYYDSDESSEISDITSPTFATYMDPPTVCDDGSIISRGVRYAAGSRFAGMTAAQVAALANRRVNDRHRADGRSVTSEDENAQELERRLDTSGTGVGGGAGAGAGSMDPAAAGGEADKQRRQMVRDEEQEPSLAPPSLAPPSMAGIGNHGSGHIRPPSLRELQRQQQELAAAQQAAAAAEEEAKQEQARLEQQQKDEEEKAQVEAAIAAAERQRAEDERLEAEKRRKAQEEEEALRRADQEARDKARARQKERRERQRREIAERQEKQRRLEEEKMQQQMQQAIDEQGMQQEATEEAADKDDAIPPPVTTQRSMSPTPPPGRKERPAIKSARPARPPSSQDPTRRPGQRPGALPGSGAQPPPRRPPARRPGQPGPPGARPGPPGPGQPMQRPDRARRQTSVPRDGQQPRGASRRPGEIRPGAAPGDRNSRPMSSDKPEKNKRRSALGTLLKAKTKFKAAAASAQANSGETSPHASHSSRTARASGGTSTRQRASQRDPTRKSLLSPSATPSSPGRRPAGRSSQRDRARPTRGMARAESAAWKQPLREEHMEKKLNPNDDSKNLDVDNLMSNMGQDIDYIFRELSTFEGQQKQKTQGVEGTDLPANPSPKIDGSDSSDSDDASLIATAKIKYTLGQLSSTLKQDEKRPRSSSNPDPLLIDEDGFLVAEGAQPTPDDAFGASSFADQTKDDKNRRSKRSELLAAKRKELQGYQNQQKLRQNSLRRMRVGTNADDDRDNQTLSTTEVEADVRNRVMSLAAGKTNKNEEEGSVGLIRGVPDLDKGERNFSTINYDDDDDISKIDAVEAATKKRIEMLRRVVAEKAVQLSAADKKGGRGSAHHHPEDDELTTKLDYVEQETMKQISRLRKRYKSTRNMDT